MRHNRSVAVAAVAAQALVTGAVVDRARGLGVNRGALGVILVAGLVVGGCAATPQRGSASPRQHEPSPSRAPERLTVAGSDLQLTANRPEGWQSFTFGLERRVLTSTAGDRLRCESRR